MISKDYRMFWSTLGLPVCGNSSVSDCTGPDALFRLGAGVVGGSTRF